MRSSPAPVFGGPPDPSLDWKDTGFNDDGFDAIGSSLSQFAEISKRPAWGQAFGSSLPTVKRGTFGDIGVGGLGSGLNFQKRGLSLFDDGAGMAQPGQQGAMGTVAGAAAMVGGEWAKLDLHNNEINAAAAKFPGMPANLLKSMINRESSGNWGEGFDQSYGGFRNDDILPFVGIFRQTADSWGLDYDSMIGNKQAQIDGMAKIMSGLASTYGGYDKAVLVYFGGEQALNGGFTDELGMNSNTYGQKAIDGWRQLDAMGGGSATGTQGGVGNVANLWGGARVEDWGEFNVESDNGLYGYASAYGLSGTTHTGLDVMGDIGTRYNSPVSGTVTCAGTGNGPGANGGGCSSFNDVMGRGAGRVEVQLDNGAVLIYGHSSESFVQAGQRVNPGDLLGSVGGMNSAHVHLEARIRDASTPSGWRIVDPRTVIGGGGGAMSGGGGAVASRPGGSFMDRVRSARRAY